MALNLDLNPMAFLATNFGTVQTLNEAFLGARRAAEDALTILSNIYSNAPQGSHLRQELSTFDSLKP